MNCLGGVVERDARPPMISKAYGFNFFNFYNFYNFFNFSNSHYELWILNYELKKILPRISSEEDFLFIQ